VEVPEIIYQEKYVEVPEIIIMEKLIEIPQVEVRVSYIEVPVVEVVETIKPVVQFVENIVQQKKYEMQYIEKVVEVPYPVYVEIPEYYDVEVEQPVYVTKIVQQERAFDVVKEVKKVVKVPVEQVVEVPVRVEVPVPVEEIVEVPYTTFKDTPWPVVVAQKLVPVLVNECAEETEVEVKQYVPYIVPVDVYVPRAVQLPYIMSQARVQEHVVTGIPVPHWNGLVFRLNTQLMGDAQLKAYAPLLHEADGSSPVAHNPPLVHPMVPVERILGYAEFLEYLKRTHTVHGPIQLGPIQYGQIQYGQIQVGSGYHQQMGHGVPPSWLNQSHVPKEKGLQRAH